MAHRAQADLTKLIVTRAAAAKGGLWRNHGYEAIYLPIYLDDQGNQLTGSKNYRLTFKQTPPTNAFWSLTMYLSANRPKRLEIQKNWLPTPSGDCRSLLRVYLPKDSLFDGSYILPEIRVSEDLF